MSVSYTVPKIVHREPYPAIDPIRPELSQKQRTILITGGSDGIGFSMARAFAKAFAARLIIVGRRPDALEKAKERLSCETGSSATVLTRACDFADFGQTSLLWSDLDAESIDIDVLVLNAAVFPDSGKLLDRGVENVWKDYEGNTKSVLHWTECFYRQNSGKRKYLVHTSSINIHNFEGLASERSSYGVTRNSGTLLLQQVARDTSPEAMQIVSFHPGYVLSQSARTHGFSEDDPIKWTSVDLPGQFAVWAATEEATFLHGRCVWANWDVTELSDKIQREQIANNQFYLRIGVNGW